MAGYLARFMKRIFAAEVLEKRIYNPEMMLRREIGSFRLGKTSRLQSARACRQTGDEDDRCGRERRPLVA